MTKIILTISKPLSITFKSGSTNGVCKISKENINTEKERLAGKLVYIFFLCKNNYQKI